MRHFDTEKIVIQMKKLTSFLFGTFKIARKVCFHPCTKICVDWCCRYNYILCWCQDKCRELLEVVGQHIFECYKNNEETLC